MISMKDYAEQKNISYEAVRKSVARYKDELEGHIVKVDRTQYLDDEAVAFLDEKRQKNPVFIIQQDKDEQIERLEREVDALKSKVIMLYERIDKKDERIEQLEAENRALLTAGSAQAAPEQPECQDELVVDAEPGDPEPQAEAAIDAEVEYLTPDEPQAAPEQKAGFAERFRRALKVLKGE